MSNSDDRQEELQVRIRTANPRSERRFLESHYADSEASVEVVNRGGDQ